MPQLFFGKRGNEREKGKTFLKGVLIEIGSNRFIYKKEVEENAKM